MRSKSLQLEEVFELYKTNEISEEFSDLLAKNINYFYGALHYDLVGQIVFMSEQLPANHPQHFKQTPESLQFADSTLSILFSSFGTAPNPVKEGDITSISVNRLESDFIFSPEYLNLLDKYIHYTGYYLPQKNNSFDSKIGNNSSNFHKYNLNLYAENLTENEFKYGVSNYFFNWFQNKNIAGGLINPYNSFKKYYPDNPFISYIDSVAKEYTNFKNITTTNFPDNINFIEKAYSISDLASLLEKFHGKNLYIDIWATSCLPCLKEFEYYEDLYRFFSLNDIDILFISIDKPNESEHWKKTIKKYNLIGYHILANKQLEADIKKGTKMIGIPWYCLKDKQGNLSKEFIYRPSSAKMLYSQINSYITE